MRGEGRRRGGRGEERGGAREGWRGGERSEYREGDVREG